MDADPRIPDLVHLHDTARERAHELRRQAVSALLDDLERALRTAGDRAGRAARRFASALHRHRALRGIALVGALALAAGVEQAYSRDADADALYHRFDVPARTAWGAVRVELSPQAWRVGGPDGPAADAAQLRAVLANVGAIEIGGRCAGWVEGPTGYPCGFAVRGLRIDGTASEQPQVLQSEWGTPDSERVRASLAAVNPELAAAGLIAPVLDSPRLVTARAPADLLGNRSAAYGAMIGFEIRALSNPLVPSDFDRRSGFVVLRGSGSGSPHQALSEGAANVR